MATRAGEFLKGNVLNKITVVCNNDGLEKAFVDTEAANAMVADKRMGEGEDSRSYWHTHEVEFEESYYHAPRKAFSLDQKTIWIDCETGGTNDKTDALVQLSAIIEMGGEVVDSIDLKMRPLPGKKVSEEALKVQG